jgi:(p)ppGpp synthase/HD superfamily hydrolase
LQFIKQAHGDQLYGDMPYWQHPRAVALTGRKIFGSKFTSYAVKTAFLHDVVEDTRIGLDELRQLEFSSKVIEAVALLTKDKTLTYTQNIEQIINSGNELAMMVKYADNFENYSGDKSSWDPARAASSQKKYLKSLNMLGDALGVSYHIEENFADGKKPGRKGLAKRMGVDCSKSETELRRIAKNSSGEKQRMAHWCANMKGGKK